MRNLLKRRGWFTQLRFLWFWYDLINFSDRICSQLFFMLRYMFDEALETRKAALTKKTGKLGFKPMVLLHVGTEISFVKYFWALQNSQIVLYNGTKFSSEKASTGCACLRLKLLQGWVLPLVKSISEPNSDGLLCITWEHARSTTWSGESKISASTVSLLCTVRSLLITPLASFIPSWLMPVLISCFSIRSSAELKELLLTVWLMFSKFLVPVVTLFSLISLCSMSASKLLVGVTWFKTVEKVLPDLVDFSGTDITEPTILLPWLFLLGQRQFSLFSPKYLLP